MILNKTTLNSTLLGLSLVLSAALPLAAFAAGSALPEEPAHGSITLNPQQGKADFAKLARLNKDEAIKAATAIAPGQVEEAELDSENHFLVWNVETVAANGVKSEVLIDAGNGEALAMEQETGDDDKNEREDGESSEGNETGERG